ncbi:Hypothetical protein POVN_LOCUS69, partial [uncultured virus]
VKLLYSVHIWLVLAGLATAAYFIVMKYIVPNLHVNDKYIPATFEPFQVNVKNGSCTIETHIITAYGEVRNTTETTCPFYHIRWRAATPDGFVYFPPPGQPRSILLAQLPLTNHAGFYNKENLNNTLLGAPPNTDTPLYEAGTLLITCTGLACCCIYAYVYAPFKEYGVWDFSRPESGYKTLESRDEPRREEHIKEYVPSLPLTGPPVSEPPVYPVLNL